MSYRGAVLNKVMKYENISDEDTETEVEYTNADTLIGYSESGEVTYIYIRGEKITP